MKIVICNQHISQALGGSELQCDLLATGLSERGHLVTYIAPLQTSQKVMGYPYKVVQVEDSARAVVAAILSTRPDIVYWRRNKRHFRAVSSALSSANIPLVFAVAHINDLLPWAAKPSNRKWLGMPIQFLRKLKSRWEYVGFQNVSALTTLNKDFISLSPVSNSHYVPNGMRAEFEPFAWPRPYVIWVGNIKPAKQPEVFLESSRVLADYGIDALMVGAIQSSGYEWLKQGCFIAPNFYYLGPRTPKEVNGILAGSLLHVHTCQPEGFGNIFIQAWLQGRPSVSLEFDPCGYIEEYGLGAIAGADKKKFKNLLIDWSTNNELANVAGKRAQAFASNAFAVETMVGRVEHILYDVVADSAK